jgi:transposase-like protein
MAQITCPSCGEVPRLHGFSANGTRRYRCINCKKTFTSTTGTWFFQKVISPQDANLVLSLRRQGRTYHSIKEITKFSYATIVGILQAFESGQIEESFSKDEHINGQKIQLAKIVRAFFECNEPSAAFLIDWSYSKPTNSLTIKISASFRDNIFSCPIIIREDELLTDWAISCGDIFTNAFNS